MKLNAATHTGIRVVAAPRRLKPEEPHGFYFGLKKRNTVVLVEPRDERVDLRNNADLLKYGKNWLAADYLSRNAGDTEVSTLPTLLRGSLSGPGKFAGEASIEFAGPFTKPQVEAMVERLPDFGPGACRVTLALEITAP